MVSLWLPWKGALQEMANRVLVHLWPAECGTGVTVILVRKFIAFLFLPLSPRFQFQWKRKSWNHRNENWERWACVVRQRGLPRCGMGFTALSGFQCSERWNYNYTISFKRKLFQIWVGFHVENFLPYPLDNTESYRKMYIQSFYIRSIFLFH